MVRVEIDKYSGFCFGVKRAIESASKLLEQGEKVYCVGDIVHNEAESARLSEMGMTIIDNDALNQLVPGGTVLFRAHGEPPASYQSVKQAGLPLKDATCPVVLKLQQRIKNAYEAQKDRKGQIVIYGKKGHAEVIGLNGQANDEAIIIENEADIKLINPDLPVEIFAQTTKSPDVLTELVEKIKLYSHAEVSWHNTTCKQVTGRVPRIKEFAASFQLIIFVGGKKSSNAKVLFEACKEVNGNSFFISSIEELNIEWFSEDIDRVGICGATSTPQWLMEQVADKISDLCHKE